MSLQDTDVAIVGAGPYGLSLAAQLRDRRVTFRIFGPPMTFWLGMPVGVNLKSLAFATNIYVPERGHTFPEWCRKRGLEDFEPCTMQSFAEYGVTMQRRFVPDLEPEEVTHVSAAAGGFEVRLANGLRVSARRVVFATGLSHFAHVPAVLRGLPRELATHTFFISDYSAFRGKEVAVVGAGASAIEAGALVLEAGGSSQVLVREAEAIFHGRVDRVRPLLQRIRGPMSVLGAGRKNWLFQELPLAVHFLPEARRVRLVRSFFGPASPWWIKDRVLGKVPIHVHSEVVSARPAGNRVQLTVRHEGGERMLEVDHVIAGTGYDIESGTAALSGSRAPWAHAPNREGTRTVDDFRNFGKRNPFRGTRIGDELRPVVPIRGRGRVLRPDGCPPHRGSAGRDHDAREAADAKPLSPSMSFTSSVRFVPRGLLGAR